MPRVGSRATAVAAARAAGAEAAADAAAQVVGAGGTGKISHQEIEVIQALPKLFLQQHIQESVSRLPSHRNRVCRSSGGQPGRRCGGRSEAAGRRAGRLQRGLCGRRLQVREEPGADLGHVWYVRVGRQEDACRLDRRQHLRQQMGNGRERAGKGRVGVSCQVDACCLARQPRLWQ